jgi:hypothetical protein
VSRMKSLNDEGRQALLRSGPAVVVMDHRQRMRTHPSQSAEASRVDPEAGPVILTHMRGRLRLA